MKGAHCLLIVLILAALAIPPCWSNDNDRAAQSASAETARPLLNSERIKQKFGSYGIDVLEDDGKLRISSLYTLDNGRKITRTLAVVIYPEDIPQQIQAEHQAIKGGGSMGEVFTRNGWRVDKENLYLGEIQASRDFDEIYSLMGQIEPVNLAVHIYRLSVCRDGSCFAYATLSEVHHPDYLQVRDLREIYKGPGDALSQDTEWNRAWDGKNEQDVQEALDLTVAALAAQ